MNASNLRTLALVGHGGAGKTTLIENLLAASGAIPAAGSVERGSTVCDYDPLEKAHLHSIKVAAAHLQHQDCLVHLLDTPGYPDFMGQALCALDAVETVVVVIDAHKGVELTTHRMMHWAQTRKLCRMIVINKIDAPDIDLPALLEEIQTAFGRECLPINLPADGGKSVTDCFFNPSGAADFSSVEAAHRALVDQVVEVYQKFAEGGGKILGRSIRDVNTVNGVRVTLEDGAWVLVRASSNKPELVVVVESMTSDDDMKALFREEVKPRLARFAEVGAYNQEI